MFTGCRGCIGKWFCSLGGCVREGTKPHMVGAILVSACVLGVSDRVFVVR